MEQKILNEILPAIKNMGYDTGVLLAFIDVETGGRGFDSKTGKLIIQFEPVWFRRKAPYAPSGKWSVNKVDVQKREWEAFNDAFRKNANAAMESTSIGLGQIMGYHYRRLGYTTVGAMWDDAKKGIAKQVGQLEKFINTDHELTMALNSQDWQHVATLYNGPNYKAVARKYGRVPYDEAMRTAFRKYKNFLWKE